MNNQKLKDLLLLFSKYAKYEITDIDTKIEDLQLDSLDIADLYFEVLDNFKLSISLEFLLEKELILISDVLSLINEYSTE